MEPSMPIKKVYFYECNVKNILITYTLKNKGSKREFHKDTLEEPFRVLQRTFE